MKVMCAKNTCKYNQNGRCAYKKAIQLEVTPYNFLNCLTYVHKHHLYFR